MSESTDPVSIALYPRLLGPAWCHVAAPVQRFHSTAQGVHGSGRLHIRHGEHPLARCLAWLLRLPRPGDAVLTQLIVRRDHRGETWHRTFAGRSLVTFQYVRTPLDLAERFGLLELRFRLGAVNGALHCTQTGTALVLGPWRLPLPACLSPRISACEEADHNATALRIAVRIDLPWLGLLMAYAGSITYEELVP